VQLILITLGFPPVFLQERAAIRAIFDHELKLGEVWNVISIGWWRLWKDYVNYDKKGEDLSTSLDTLSLGAVRPGTELFFFFCGHLAFQDSSTAHVESFPLIRADLQCRTMRTQ
jgi:hypothetical protein